MSSKKDQKTCLVISYGPVPTSEYKTVEGGGMRAWGLAQGLKNNGIDVTVAVNESFPQNITIYEDIFLTVWRTDESFKRLFNGFDAVIISYCMGDVSEFVATNIQPEIQLILDVYVPIYVEVSARDSDDIEREYIGYMREIERYNKVLKRGDYFLCANDAQKIFYTGVLSSLGIVNPRSYRESRILVTPFGIYEGSPKSSLNPYESLGITRDDFVVLWFGGLYPWFRIEELLQAMFDLRSHKHIKFVIVGSKNPFNTNEDFVRQHIKAFEYVTKQNLLNKSVYFVDWVDYDQRVHWYRNADIVVSFNQPGEENAFSWRTRVMDYIWGDMVIITNGGDPLSNELIEKRAAIKIEDLSSKAIKSTVLDIYKHTTKITNARKELIKLKPKYFWNTITEPVAEIIKLSDSLKPFQNELEFSKSINLDNQNVNSTNKLLSLPRKAYFKTIEYTKQHGLRNTVKYSFEIISNSKKLSRPSTAPNYIFISHPIDNTGAPLVLMQIVDEFVKKYGTKRVKLVAPNVSPNNKLKLKKIGLRVEKAAAAFTDRIMRFQLGLKPNDYVLMNTIAIHENYRNFILNELQTGRLLEAHWFIHEDEAQLHAINPKLLEKHTLQLISKLIRDDKLKVFVPSKRTQKSYNKIFQTNKVVIVPLRIEIDKKYNLKRPPSDYEKINFLLSGSPADGRKGQLIAIAAFEKFYEAYYKKNPKAYRKYSLNLLSIGDDYISQQIKWIGGSLMGNKLKLIPSVPYAEALEITAKCNAVVCCSLNETFALYVAEGMYMGHVILRNDTSGIDEQLREGKNGFKIDHHDVIQFSQVIEGVLNKSTRSNHELMVMGRNSQEIIEPFIHNKYTDILS